MLIIKFSNNKNSNDHNDIATTSPVLPLLELCMNLHNSAMSSCSPYFTKNLVMTGMRRLAQEMQLNPLCAGQCGLYGAPGVCGVHSWGRGPRYGPESMPILSPPGAEGHLSLRPRSKLPGGWSPEFWQSVTKVLPPANPARIQDKGGTAHPSGGSCPVKTPRRISLVAQW